MKNILQQMMEESYNDRRRAKSRFIRSVIILLVALITPFLFSMMLMLFRILVFDSNTFKIEDVSYNAAQDPQNIHVTAGFANRSPLHVKVSDISIDFYVSTESRKYLLLFAVKKDETILQKGKQIAVKDHLLKIVDIRNENTLCLLRAKKIKIALRYKLSLRIFGVYLGRHMTSDYIVDLENNGSKVKKDVEIWQISPANDAIEIDLRFIGYVMSDFFRIYIPRLTLEVKCSDYLLDVIVDPMSVDNGVVQENLRVILKFHPTRQLCVNDIIKKVIKTRTDNRDHLQLAICSLKNDCGIFNRFFDKLDIPILTLLSNSAGKSGEREDDQDDSPDINVNYDLDENAIFLKKVGRGSTIFQYLFGVLYTLTLNCTIEKEMVAKIVIQQHIKDHMLKAKVKLINLQRIIAAILNNDTIYMRVNLPNPTLRNVFQNFFISYAVKDGFVFSFSEITEKITRNLPIEIDHTIKEQPLENLVEINSAALSCVEDDKIESVINFSGFRFKIHTETFSMNCFVRLSLFFTSNNVFSGLSFVSSVDLRILAPHRLIERKEELSDCFKRIKVNDKHKIDLFGLLSGDKKTPWYKQLADNSCYIVEGIREKVHGMLSKNSYIGINDYFIKNMISGGTAITFTFYDKSNDKIANVEIDLRKFVVFYSKTYGIYVDGLHNSFNVDILGLGAFSEYYRVSCTSSSLISQFIRPFTLFGEFAEKQIIKPENIVMGDAQTLACIKLETSHGLGISGTLHYAEDGQTSRNTKLPGLRIFWPNINLESKCEKTGDLFRMYIEESNVALTSFAKNTRESLGHPLSLRFSIHYKTLLPQQSEGQNDSERPPDGSKAEISEPSGRKFFLNKFFKEYEIFTVQNFIKFLSKGDNTETDTNEPTVVEVIVDDNPYIAKIVLKNPNLWRKMGRIWSFHKFLGFATLPSSVSFHLDVKSFVLLRLSIFMVDLIVVHADIGETLTLPIYYTRHDGQYNNPTYEVHSNHNLNFTTKISLTIPRDPPSFSILNFNTFEAWSDISRFVNGERRELIYRNKRRQELFYLLIPVGFRLILNLKHDLRIFIGLNSNLYFELNIGKFTYDGAVFFPICLDSAKKKGFDFSNIHQWHSNAAYPFNAYLVYGDMLLEGSSFGLNGSWNYFIPPIVDFLANPDLLTRIGSIFGWNIPHDETLEQHYTMDKILQMMNRCYLSGDADSTMVLRDNAYREQTLTPETV